MKQPQRMKILLLDGTPHYGRQNQKRCLQESFSLCILRAMLRSKGLWFQVKKCGKPSCHVCKPVRMNSKVSQSCTSFLIRCLDPMSITTVLQVFMMSVPLKPTITSSVQEQFETEHWVFRQASSMLLMLECLLNVKNAACRGCYSQNAS